jgi:hypothetical protein
MGVKAKVPFGVAIEGAELAMGGTLPFIAPSEAPVLEVDLGELTSVDGSPEAVDEASIDIASILISCPPNLIKIVKDKSSHPIRRLEGNKLRKEVIFSARSGGPINPRDFEITVNV